MKKIFLMTAICLISMSTYAQSVAEVKALIDANIASNSKISALKLREVQYALADLTQSTGPILSGSLHLGDVGTDQLTLISFSNINTSDYYVMGSLRSNGSDYNKDNDVFWQWRDPTATSFKIATREVSSDEQDLTFYWQIYKL